jgi:hypothetical protein
MNRRTEREIIGIMREEYKRRLVEVAKMALGEADLVDKRGNVLPSAGLKVRHKKSGYEYTVIKADQEYVYLRHPDQPRFNPPDAETTLIEGEEVDLNNIDYRKVAGMPVPSDPPTSSVPEMEPEENPSVLRVNRKDYEQNYEVK